MVLIESSKPNIMPIFMGALLEYLPSALTVKANSCSGATIKPTRVWGNFLQNLEQHVEARHC